MVNYKTRRPTHDHARLATDLTDTIRSGRIIRFEDDINIGMIGQCIFIIASWMYLVHASRHYSFPNDK